MRIIEKIRQKKQIVRAVLYARFSSDNQREESIDAQVRAIRDYARKNSIIVVGEYIDKAKSAMTDNRPEFLRMVSDSAKEGFDLVLVHKLDRFARNRQDSIGYRMELKKHIVSLVSVLEYLDDESPESLILESVLEAMAEYYSKNLAREVNKGMKENALKGLHTGGKPPLGFNLNPETKMLVINKKEAEAVRLTYKMFNEGNEYGRIIDELNLRGYKSKVGKSFRNNSLTNVVRNEKYIDIYVFYKLTSKDHRGKRNGNSFKDAEEIIRVEGVVPAIISPEEFRIAQMKINFRKHSRAANNAKEVYLLSTKLQSECEMITELLRKCIEENAYSALDQAEYNKRYSALAERYETTKKGIVEINDKRLEHNAKRESIRAFIRMLEQSDTLLTEFDEELWNATVDTVTVHSEHEITFVFKDGTGLEYII